MLAVWARKKIVLVRIFCRNDLCNSNSLFIPWAFSLFFYSILTAIGIIAIDFNFLLFNLTFKRYVERDSVQVFRQLCYTFLLKFHQNFETGESVHSKSLQNVSLDKKKSALTTLLETFTVKVRKLLCPIPKEKEKMNFFPKFSSNCSCGHVEFSFLVSATLVKLFRQNFQLFLLKVPKKLKL